MRFSTTLLVLASAAVALAQQVIVSKGLFIARDESDPNATGADIFKHPRNHVIATGSILRRAAQSSQYLPSKQDPTKTRAGFFEFQYKAASFLGFVEYDVPYKEQLKLEGGLRNLEKTILEAYESYENKYIAQQLVKLVPKKGQKDETKSYVLSLVTINKRNANNYVETKLINVALRLKTNEKGEIEVPAQNAYLNVRHFVVDATYLEKNAEKLAQNVEKATAADFKGFFSSRAVDAAEGWFDFE
ncbi:hypothetical protein DFQ26_009740 [Actinomortierella ambigua]|nr:hypothetical protein DFQ26_009740 [Actinomortierella ambigua]